MTEATAPEPAPAPEAASQGGGLKRAIGPGLLFFFILGDMLGGGIYALVGEVAAEVGGAVWLAFAAAFLLASLTAFAYVELVTKYPRAAGAALYVHLGFKRPFLTFMAAFIVMASGVTSAGSLARAFAGDYFTELVSAPTVLVAVVFVVVAALVNAWGIAESVRTNLVFTLIEVSGLVLVVVLGGVALADGSGDFSRNFTFTGGGSPPLLLVLAGAALAFYALIGFEDSVNVAEEVREPSRAYPRALFGALIAAGIIYVLVTMSSSTIVPTGQLADSAGLLEVVRQGPLGVPTTLFSVIALFALANGALINLIMASRLVYGMAEEGIAPSVFSRLLPRRATPYVAIVFTAAIAAILVATGDLEVLADTTVLLLLVVFTLVNISCLVLRSDDVDHDHFHAPTVLPVLGAVVSVGLMTQNEAGVWLRAGLLVLVGLVFWFANQGAKKSIDTTKLGG